MDQCTCIEVDFIHTNSQFLYVLYSVYFTLYLCCAYSYACVYFCVVLLPGVVLCSVMHILMTVMCMQLFHVVRVQSLRLTTGKGGYQ